MRYGWLLCALALAGCDKATCTTKHLEVTEHVWIENGRMYDDDAALKAARVEGWDCVLGATDNQGGGNVYFHYSCSRCD